MSSIGFVVLGCGVSLVGLLDLIFLLGPIVLLSYCCSFVLFLSDLIRICCLASVSLLLVLVSFWWVFWT